jgi:erythromycin esterase
VTDVTASAARQAPGPLTDSQLDDLTDAIALDATVVGLGESTRFARETFQVRDQIFRRLVRAHGIRALAIQDHAAATAAINDYVHAGDGSATTALDDAWSPWRTAEMAATLNWMRTFNRDHPRDPIHVFGVKPIQAQAADYDAIQDHVRTVSPEQATQMASHLEPLRTAHHIDEHVQRARGTHPGRPFTEHAHDALTLLRALPPGPQHDDALARMRLIIDFHERSVAGRHSYASDAASWAAVISEHQQRTGDRVAYWDGIAHTSAAPVTLGIAPERGPQPTTGSILRQRYAAGYLSVGIGFHHGDLGIASAPAPASDLIDATLSHPQAPAYWLNLRHDDASRRRWQGPAKARVISGIYDPTRDAIEYLAVASLPDAFDVLVHIDRVSPVQRLNKPQLRPL